MSPVTQAKSTWWRQHYEKLLLVLVLVALLVSTAILFVHVNEGQRQVQGTSRDVPPANQEGVPPLDASASERSMAELRQPFQAPPMSNLMFISEQRVWCVRCGKPILLASEKCPFCGNAQPIFVPGDADSDGMSDEFEKAFGFNANDPADARQDADSDGFSNLEESLAKSNPRDDKSFPDVIAKVRLEKVTQKPLPLIFVGVQDLGGDDLRFQINVGGRSHFAKIDDVVSGYKVKSYDKVAQVLTTEKGEKTVPLKKNQRTIDEELHLDFVFLIDGSTASARVGETFRIRTRDYTVARATPEEVEVSDADGAKHTVKRLSPEESMELMGLRSRLSPFDAFEPSAEAPAPSAPPAAAPPAYAPPRPPAYVAPAPRPPYAPGPRGPPPEEEMAPPEGAVGPQP